MYSVHFRGVLLVTSRNFVALVRSRSTRLWRWFHRSQLVAGPVVERHLNYIMTFQVPLRQFTSLGVKFDLYGHFKLPLRSFTAFTTLRSFTWFYWALRNFTYLVMSCKFAISCCESTSVLSRVLFSDWLRYSLSIRWWIVSSVVVCAF